jgi:hypothetical protein
MNHSAKRYRTLYGATMAAKDRKRKGLPVSVSKTQDSSGVFRWECTVAMQQDKSLDILAMRRLNLSPAFLKELQKKTATFKKSLETFSESMIRVAQQVTTYMQDVETKWKAKYPKLPLQENVEQDSVPEANVLSWPPWPHPITFR